jgi:hypothetical protein
MRATRASTLEQSVSSCLGFLLEAQSSEGCWSDWDLPPGRSSIWTTAYVGLRILELPAQLRSHAAPALRSAARWLQLNELGGGGWGYSSQTGCDADSTAHALLFLSRAGVRLPKETYLRLLRFQQADGGFSTYDAEQGFGSWGATHVDVSAVGALAVRRVEDAFERAVAYVLHRCTHEGLWNSFWWSSPLYATRASLALLRAAHPLLDVSTTRTALQRLTPENPFERALLLDALHLCDGAPTLADDLWASLTVEQLGDGSWPSVPILRITRRTCDAPWDSEDAGELYADNDRLFTSATVAAALGRQLARAAAGSRSGVTSR